MASLQPLSSKHRCQIDCTNHDEVISSLELKSKDLYYFWRNYEWLYNKYYSSLNQQQPIKIVQNHTECRRELQTLEAQYGRLMNQNMRLKVQLQSCRKQLTEGSTSKLQLEYQRQLTIWQNKVKEYQQINEKLIAENNQLKLNLGNIQQINQNLEAENSQLKLNFSNIQQINEKLVAENGQFKLNFSNNQQESFGSLINLQQRLEETNRKYQESMTENQRLKNNILNIEQEYTQKLYQMQSNIEQLQRQLSSKGNFVMPSAPAISRMHIQEFSKNQSSSITNRIRSLNAETERVVAIEFDSLKGELQNRLAQMLSELTQRELQTVIVSLQS